MPFIQYVEYKPKPKAAALIVQCNRILDEMSDRGYTLTLRQLYYQLVTENLIENNIKSYNSLKGIVSSARDGGMIDWNHIQDRGRSVRSFPHWDDPGDFIRHVVPQFRVDRWEDQPRRIEVWVEKEALVDVVARPARQWDVPYFANKGYVSASAAWAAGRRFMRYGFDQQDVTILHLGDHDPSGIDMTRDITERLWQYSRMTEDDSEGHQDDTNTSGDPHRVDIQIRRLALNMDQVEDLNLQPNPAKLTDSRAPDYCRQFGEDSWELDAIPVERIEQIIADAIQEIVDQDRYDARVELEQDYDRQMRDLPPNWDEVTSFLRAFDYDRDEARSFLRENDPDHEDEDDFRENDPDHEDEDD